MHFAIRLVGALALIFLTAPAHAQDYPTKPIRLIVPFPPGGPNDIIARVVGRENVRADRPADRDRQSRRRRRRARHRCGRKGRAGRLHDRDHLAGALAISKSLQEKLPYDTLKDLKPVTLVAKVPELLVVANQRAGDNRCRNCWRSRRQSRDSSISLPPDRAQCRISPANCSRSAAGIDIVHVPYKGAAPAVNDIIGEQVQMVFLDIPVLLPQVQAGKVQARSRSAASERAPSLPDVPTTGEVGLPQIEAENWYGMVAPAATPPAVIAKLHRITAEALKSPEVRDKLSSQGAILVGNTPEEFAAYIQSEIDKWGKVAKAANIKAGQ